MTKTFLTFRIITSITYIKVKAIGSVLESSHFHFYIDTIFIHIYIAILNVFIGGNLFKNIHLIFRAFLPKYMTFGSFFILKLCVHTTSI